jgi:hypothetical protein
VQLLGDCDEVAKMSKFHGVSARVREVALGAHHATS